MERSSIQTGKIYNMSDETKIEYIGPKILVIVRIPESLYEPDDGQTDFEKHFADISSNDDFKHYCFIIVRQSRIYQIEFEYPKNYHSIENKPTAILSSKSMSDAEKEGLLKAFNTK